MAKYYLLSIFVTSILFSGNSASLRIPGWADTVYIHGEIKTPRQKNKSIVTFHVNDYVTGKLLNYYSSIDSTGKFDVKFFLRNTQDIFWRYNEDSLFRLIISPKDSLTIIINKGGIHFSGRNAKASEDINIMRSPYRKAFPSKEEEKAVGHLEPEDYLIFRRQQKDKQIKFLESFCKSRNCSALFREWYLADCEVNYYNELLAYGWKSLKYGIGSTARRYGCSASTHPRWRKWNRNSICCRARKVGNGIRRFPSPTGCAINTARPPYHWLRR